MSTEYPHVVLIVLDGWGVAQPSVGNAITQAKLDTFDMIAANYPIFNLQASGESVGLPWGEQGNSEVGHLSIGSGRIIYQNLPRITKSISDGSFMENAALKQAMAHAKLNESGLHLIGLVSDGGVHAYNEHLYALLEMAKFEDIKRVYVHAILDGRDTPKKSGLAFITKLEAVIDKLQVGSIATVGGRFYAMDRDNHWERIEPAYRAMVEGVSDVSATVASQAVAKSYESGVFDEEMRPTVIKQGGKPVATVQDRDAVIMFNFRPDRARQLTKALVLDEFDGFTRKKRQDLFFVSMTEYEKGLPVQVAFPPLMIGNPLAKLLSEKSIRQVHIAETEKYAHVTYFFNGGREEPWPGEEHVLVPSARVDSYADQPEMSAPEITKKVLESLSARQHQFILVNYANADMVGHTGDLKATIRAVEILDQEIGKIVEMSLLQGGVCLITADHGNAEEVIKLKDGSINKEHSARPVPFMLVGKDWEGRATVNSLDELYLNTPVGVLADVAPTILKLFGIEEATQMTGQSLV